MLLTYFATIRKLLAEAVQAEEQAMEQAAAAVAKTVMTGGIIHVFGSGHSHILAEELYYRAGGLAAVRPVVDMGLQPCNGAVKSTELEQSEGYGASVAGRQDFAPGDLLVVVSNSGRNPAPIEVALFAKQCGMQVIALTSLRFSNGQPSRHSSGKRLFEVCDLTIDSHVPPGDAALCLAELAAPFAPVSTVAGAAILNAVLARAIQIMVEEGFQPPVFISSNSQGWEKNNAVIMEKYKGRVQF